MADFEKKLKKISVKDLREAIPEVDIMKLRSHLDIIYSSNVAILNSRNVPTKKIFPNHV
ncbi:MULTISPECIES: hypothetical protein [Maribellus]|uniref:Uncharacterized protein n=1 Tax=Maribellus comscasis TaxID=2681766 RepID=A0A6I6JY89_9BACT|nr:MULTISPECIES: hypothetical protein [Maribellus]MCG6190937.1 hypothetical protein [Maribellus maritimus]QGY46118.1 hypothetical protein GM418_21335 [Maribellus comscasis]